MQDKKPYSPKIITKRQGRRMAIGDIHGCFYTLKSLLERINPQKDDQLFFLGDYINRGNHSAKVLDCFIELKKSNPNIFLLRGTHEQKFLLAYSQGMEFFENFLADYNSLDLLNENLYQYLDFCHELEYCFVSGKQFLSHCGIAESVKTPLNDLRAMFGQIEIAVQDDIVSTYDMIYGHVTTSIIQVQQKLKEEKLNLSIDTGCVYKENPELGYLCALNLDTLELVRQKNIEP